MNIHSKTIPSFALLIAALIAPQVVRGQVTLINDSGAACPSGCEQLRFETPYNWTGTYPRVMNNCPSGPLSCQDNYPTAPFFDGAIAPISYNVGTTKKVRFNASAGARNYQLTANLTGATFTPLTLTSSSVHNATHARENTAFAWGEWLYGTFRKATSTSAGPVYAALYNEYYGGRYNAFDQNVNGYSAMGLAVSSNNGLSFQKITDAPNHVFARVPYLHPNGPGCSMFGGIFKSPLDQLYYCTISDFAGAALFRTNDLDQPGSWRGLSPSGSWDVSGLPLTPNSYKNIDVYPLYLGWSDYFKKYIAVTIGNVTGNYGSVGNNQIVYNLSEDLIRWGPARRIMSNPACGADFACGADEPEVHSYPSIMDPIYLADTANSTKASNGITGSRPLVTYIKNPHNPSGVDQQFATQRVNFESVIFNRMDNFSMRGVVGPGTQSLVMGVIMQGAEAKQFVFRGLGSSLPFGAEFGYPKIANPRITVYGPDGSVIGSNTGWRSLSSDDQTTLTQSNLQPGSDNDSALVVTLTPTGNYTNFTVIMDNGSGVGVIDAYDLSSTAESRVAQIAVRGYSQPGNGALTMGFISRGGQTAVVRGTSHSTLSPAGFSPVIGDPYLSVHNAGGTIIASNHDYNNPTYNGSIVSSYGLAPGHPQESATRFFTYSPVFSPTAPNSIFSNYSVVLQGTGFGLLELYNVNAF